MKKIILIFAIVALSISSGISQTIKAVTDKTSNIELLFSTGKKVRICKEDVKIKLEGNNVYLFDASNSSQVSGTMGETSNYLILYNSLTVPQVSASALFEYIQAMLNTGSPAGVTINQITQLDQLRELSGVPSVFKDPVSDRSLFGATSRVSSIALDSAIIGSGLTNRNLLLLTGYNNSSSAVYIHVYNKTLATLTAGDIPKIVFKADANSNFSFNCNAGYLFNTAITVASSSTLATYTAVPKNCWFNVVVR